MACIVTLPNCRHNIVINNLFLKQKMMSVFKSYGYFLNINRYFKSTVGEDIKFNEYPYDNLWNAEISKNSFLQDNHHFLLVQRQINEGNIKNELLKLKNYNKNYENSIFGRLPLIKHFKKFVWLISKTILINLFTKKFLKKLAKVIYNFSEIRN